MWVCKALWHSVQHINPISQQVLLSQLSIALFLKWTGLFHVRITEAEVIVIYVMWQDQTSEVSVQLPMAAALHIRMHMHMYFYEKCRKTVGHTKSRLALSSSGGTKTKLRA